MTDNQFEAFLTILMNTQLSDTQLSQLSSQESTLHQHLETESQAVRQRRRLERQLNQRRRRLRRQHRELQQTDYPATRTAQDALTIVEQTWQTRVLSTSDKTLLKDNTNSSIIAAKLRQLIQNRDYLSHDLLTLFSDQSPSERLMQCLLMVLHSARLIDVLKRHHQLNEAFQQCIILSVLLRQHRRDRSLIQARQETYRLVRRGKQSLLARLNRMVDDTQGFDTTYQAFYHQMLDSLLSLKEDWKQDALRANQYLHLPTNQEMETYYDILGKEKAVAYAIRVRNSLNTQRNELTQKIRLRGISREERAIYREDRDELNQRYRQQRQHVFELRSQARRMRAQLGRMRLRYCQQHYERLRDGRFNPRESSNRDTFLRWADDKIANLTTHRLWTANEQQRWQTYHTVLEKLVSKENMVAIEVLTDTYLQRYGKINTNRNMALYHPFKGHTYPGHPDGAVDIITQAGHALYVIAPPSIQLPTRLMKNFPNLPDDLHFQYVASRVGRSIVSVTSDLQDIFAKLSFGLLRTRGNQRTSSSQIERIMEQHMGSPLAPETVCNPETRHYEERRIIAGLAFRRLTEDEENLDDIDSIREEILNDWQRLINQRLNLPPDTVLFRSDRREAHAGHVGVGRLITFRDPQRNITLGSILRAAREVLESPAQSHRSQDNSNGLVHRIWRLMTSLRTDHGVEANRRAQSVVIDHTYQAMYEGNTIPLTISPYHTHLHSVASAVRGFGQPVNLGVELGQVGLTGNAISSHLHIEIKVKLNNIQISPMLPHEFYPLYSVVPRPLINTNQEQTVPA